MIKMTKQHTNIQGKRLKASKTTPTATSSQVQATSNKVSLQLTLSTDPKLYFHTNAAEQISDLLKHDDGDRIRLAKKMFKAIQKGDIDAYSHRDGQLIKLPIELQPLCVRASNINDWLKGEGYAIRWAPDNQVETALPSPAKQSPEERQIERWKFCIGMGLVMPIDTYGPYPRGIGKAAKILGISRQSLTSDLDKYRERRFC
jgi:hypothetical protein